MMCPVTLLVDVGATVTSITNGLCKNDSALMWQYSRMIDENVIHIKKSTIRFMSLHSNTILL